MKIFLVDVHNAIGMSYYETFFYQNIKQGNISVFESSLDSLDGLDLVLAWITEEINRNPFSIDQALVIFFLPRKLAERRIPQDFDIFAQMYINELLSRHLDHRFRYLCFFVDDTGKERIEDRIYKEIDNVNDSFSSDDPVLRDSFLPTCLPEGDPKENTKRLIESMPDSVSAAFYQRILVLLDKTEMKDENGKLNVPVEDWYRNMFLRTCRESIFDIKTFRSAYFTDDITQKIEVVLKIVKYICSFADSFDVEKDFDTQLTSFLNPKNFKSFNVDMTQIRKEIATYRRRLSSCKLSAAYPGKDQLEAFSFEGGDHSKEFQDKVKHVSMEDLRSALHPSINELSEFDLQEKVFVSLDRLIEDVNQMLRAFCEERIAEMRQFWKKSLPTQIERSEGISLQDDEQKEEQLSADRMNQYITNELPGYPAELKLRQELELLGKRIRRIGRYLKAMKKTAFVCSLLFALSSIGFYYYGLQYSVFAKENTWDVFGGYLAVFAVLFIFSYLAVRVYYKRRIRKCLKQCLELVMVFLQGYISRAKEFEMNLNAAMNYYCSVDENNKKTAQRFNHTDYEKRVQWHRLKIKKILSNLSFFDAFLRRTEPDNEKGVPGLNLFEDDAAHSDFYQMRIFK